MAFAYYRIFSLFELSLSCVTFNAQDIDLTEQIYEIETPRWSDALGWGLCFPWAYFTPPAPLPGFVLTKWCLPPSLSKSPLNRFFIGLQMLLPRTFCGQCMFFAFVGKRWRWGCFPRLSVFVFRLIRRWIYWHRLHQLTNCTDDNLWGRGWDEVRWGTWGVGWWLDASGWKV